MRVATPASVIESGESLRIDSRKTHANRTECNTEHFPYSARKIRPVRARQLPKIRENSRNCIHGRALLRSVARHAHGLMARERRLVTSPANSQKEAGQATQPNRRETVRRIFRAGLLWETALVAATTAFSVGTLSSSAGKIRPECIEVWPPRRTAPQYLNEGREQPTRAPCSPWITSR
jgi:hypothetical protein